MAATGWLVISSCSSAAVAAWSWPRPPSTRIRLGKFLRDFFSASVLRTSGARASGARAPSPADDAFPAGEGARASTSSLLDDTLVGEPSSRRRLYRRKTTSFIDAKSSTPETVRTINLRYADLFILPSS